MEFIDYFQLVFLFLFYTLFFGRTVILFKKGIQVFVLGKGKKGLNRYLEISFFILLLVWTIMFILYALNRPVSFIPRFFTVEFIDYFVCDIIGMILNIAGIIIFILALISFGKSWRIGIDKNNPGKLVTQGIFSISRNPIFLFIDLFFIGTWCIYSNLFFLLCALIVVAGIHFQIKKEEDFLISHYGIEYKEYKEKTRRYL